MEDLANSLDQLKVEEIKEGSQTLLGLAFAVEKHDAIAEVWVRSDNSPPHDQRTFLDPKPGLDFGRHRERHSRLD